jgi:peptide/nickel transport system permease protein
LGFESLPGSPTLPAVNGSLPAFLARRLALLALTMVLVPSLSFLMFTVIQGAQAGPVDVLRQLVDYLAAVFLQGDLGGDHFRSGTFVRTRGALEVVRQGFLIDCALVVGAIGFAAVAGLLAGKLQATRRRSARSRAVTVLIALALASPVYFVALMVLLLFAPGLGSVAEVPFVSSLGGYRDPGSDLVGFVRSMWLPCVIAGAPLAAGCARMAAATLGATLADDYVRTARAKGVRERNVIWRHALPTAAAPVVALIAVNMNLLLTNIALIEAVFNIPGAFRFIERALTNHDVDLVQALVVEATFFIVVANFLADAIQGTLDPRVRHGRPL